MWMCDCELAVTAPRESETALYVTFRRVSILGERCPGRVYMREWR